MNRLLLLLGVGGFIGCQPAAQPNDVGARASGRYAVDSYVINGDTLYSSQGVNKINVSEFYILVDRRSPDSVRVSSVYKATNNLGSQIYSKDVGVRETNGSFQLVAPATVSSDYQGRIEANTFYEQTGLGKGGSLIVLLPSYLLKAPTNPALAGVFISAHR